MKNIRIGAEHVDLDWIHKELSQKSYWAEGRTLEEMQTLVEESRCYSVYDRDRQIGFARVVTDLAAFGYLADVWVDEEYRGRGIGKALLDHILEDPELSRIGRWLLATRDAHSFYGQFGFGTLANPDRIMEIDRR